MEGQVEASLSDRVGKFINNKNNRFKLLLRAKGFERTPTKTSHERLA